MGHSLLHQTRAGGYGWRSWLPRVRPIKRLAACASSQTRKAAFLTKVKSTISTRFAFPHRPGTKKFIACQRFVCRVWPKLLIFNQPVPCRSDGRTPGSNAYTLLISAVCVDGWFFPIRRWKCHLVPELAMVIRKEFSLLLNDWSIPVQPPRTILWIFLAFTHRRNRSDLTLLQRTSSEWEIESPWSESSKILLIPTTVG